MIPARLVDFLSDASVAVASTRDSSLVPHLHWLSGWYVDPGQESVVALVSRDFTTALHESLADNGHFAMVAERIGPHECYQFKGHHLDSWPAKPDDRERVEACRERFARAVRGLYGDRYAHDLLRDRVREPAVAVRFHVDEIYLQTPGPEAGKRITPEDP